MTGKPSILVAALASALLGGAPAAAATSAPPTWAQAADAPELARAGPERVGTTTITIPLAARPGAAGAAPAELGVRLYYPAAPSGGSPAVYVHSITLPKTAPFTVEEHGLGFAGAAPKTGGKFPLVIVSHGLGGWSAHFSRVLELVASHGYVVAALDHADEKFATVPEFFAAFGNVLLRRPADQRGAVTVLTADAQRLASDPLALTDPAAPIGLIGYSMGGYGAFNAAGADYAAAGQPFAAFSQATKDALATPSPVTAKIGALVALAPWGGQPDSRAFAPDKLGQVTAPTLLIAGDQDEAVNYGQGVRWLFDGAKRSDRYLLTLREAKHNIAGNAIDSLSGAPPEAVGFFAEPVWRQERLNQVVAHFIVAFLDRTLKRDATRSSYIDVPVSDSNKGVWPIAFGEQTGAMPAGPNQPQYWRGFPRGWAVGMTMEHKKAGE